jgi:hypothetical protein
MTEPTEALLEERGRTHGPWSIHARITSRLKDVLSDECRDRCLRGQQPLTPEQRESLDMIMHKVGRIVAGQAGYHDHWDDIAGYAKLCSKPVPLNPRIEENLRRIEERTPACPDLDQELPVPKQRTGFTAAELVRSTVDELVSAPNRPVGVAWETPPVRY